MTHVNLINLKLIKNKTIEFWVLLSTKKNMSKTCSSNSLSEEARRSFKPVMTRTGIMYGLCKVHKGIIDNCPPSWPILSAINTRNFKLVKFLVLILKSLTSTEFTVKGIVCFY